MTAVIDYGARAGNSPRPASFYDDWTGAHDDWDVAFAAFKATGRIFWADISEFQPVVDSTYPYSQLCIRLDNGWRMDANAQSNRRVVGRIARIEALIGYVVFIPGQTGATLKRLKSNFGSSPEFAVSVDMESGEGFAGPGNHSNEANDFVGELVDWNGPRARELGYANGFDWSGNWPDRPSWMKRNTAAYGTHDPGTWGWQYYGGLDYPTLPGFPRAVKPFGGWVDINTASMTHSKFVSSLGLEKDWLSMATRAETIDAYLDALESKRGQDALVKAVRAAHPKFSQGRDGKAHTLEQFLGRIKGGDYTPFPKPPAKG